MPWDNDLKALEECQPSSFIYSLWLYYLYYYLAVLELQSRDMKPLQTSVLSLSYTPSSRYHLKISV